MTTLNDFQLEPDLKTGIVPISRAASSLAALIRRATTTRRPIAITQKGYPEAVLLSVELWTALKQLADQIDSPGAEQPLPFTPPWDEGGVG